MTKLTKEQEKRFDEKFGEIWTEEWNDELGAVEGKSAERRLKQFLADELARQRKELAIEYDKKVQEYFAKVIKAIKEMK